MLQNWLARLSRSLKPQSRRSVGCYPRRQRVQRFAASEVLEVRSLLAANITASLTEVGGKNECPGDAAQMTTTEVSKLSNPVLETTSLTTTPSEEMESVARNPNGGEQKMRWSYCIPPGKFFDPVDDFEPVDRPTDLLPTEPTSVIDETPFAEPSRFHIMVGIERRSTLEVLPLPSPDPMIGPIAINNEASLTHRYEFNDSLNDESGGSALTANGGTVVNGRYQFGANQGLILSDGLVNPSNYSVELVMKFDSLDSYYQKLIDFSNLTSDSGLYLTDGQLQLYPNDPGTGHVSANTDFHLVLTVDAANQEAKVYLNGQLQWTVHGTEVVPTTNLLTFFTDDTATASTEAGAGSVESIAIYDGVLSAEDVSELGQSFSITVDGSNDPITLPVSEIPIGDTDNLMPVTIGGSEQPPFEDDADVDDSASTAIDEIELADNATSDNQESSENVTDIDLAFTNFASPL